jgi:hypothetical protein
MANIFTSDNGFSLRASSAAGQIVMSYGFKYVVIGGPVTEDPVSAEVDVAFAPAATQATVRNAVRAAMLAWAAANGHTGVIIDADTPCSATPVWCTASRVGSDSASQMCRAPPRAAPHIGRSDITRPVPGDVLPLAPTAEWAAPSEAMRRSGHQRWRPQSLTGVSPASVDPALVRLVRAGRRGTAVH